MLRPYHHNYVDQSLAKIQLSDRCILEIGCGSGDLVKHLAGRQPAPRLVVGLDLHVNPEEGPGYLLIKGDARDLPFRDDCFDLVYALAVFEHLPDLGAILKEISRVLKTGGWVSALVNPVWSGFRGHHYGPDLLGRDDVHLIDLPWAHLMLEPEQFVRYLHLAEGFSLVEAESAGRWVFESPQLNRLTFNDYIHMFRSSPLELSVMEPGLAVLDGPDGLLTRFKRCADRSRGWLAPDGLVSFLSSRAEEKPLIYKFTAELVKY